MTSSGVTRMGLIPNRFGSAGYGVTGTSPCFHWARVVVERRASVARPYAASGSRRPITSGTHERSTVRIAFRSSAGIFGVAAWAVPAAASAAIVARRSAGRLIPVACHGRTESAYSVAVSGDAEDRIRADRIAKVDAMRAAGV